MCCFAVPWLLRPWPTWLKCQFMYNYYIMDAADSRPFFFTTQAVVSNNGAFHWGTSDQGEEGLKVVINVHA